VRAPKGSLALCQWPGSRHDGDRNIARQKVLIAEMLPLGLNISSHEATMANFEETQRLHVEHVRRLKQELISAAQF
jgi:hypothetical protein